MGAGGQGGFAAVAANWRCRGAADTNANDFHPTVGIDVAATGVAALALMNVRRLVLVAAWIATASSSWAATTNDWPARLKTWRAQQGIPGCSVALLRDGRVET